VVLRLFSHHLPVYDCRYTLDVVSSAVCNPPRVEHSHVTCSYNDGNLTSTTCKYICNEGFAAPTSSVPYLTWNCSSGHSLWNKTTTPKCIRRTSPVALEGQCKDIHLTMDAASEVDAAIELGTPQFRSSSADRSSIQFSIEVVCNINSVATAGLFQRQCVARDTQTDAKTFCNYNIRVTRSKCDKLAAPLNGELKCSRQEKTIVCIIDCNKGHSFYVASINSSSSLHIYGENVALCDLDTGLWTVAHRPIHSADLQCKLDSSGLMISASFHFQMAAESCHVAEKVLAATRSALLEQNAYVCRQANCSLMSTACRPCDKSIRCNKTLEMNWTITVEKDRLRRGEALVHKLQIETERMISTDLNFHRLIQKFGAKINQRSFKVGKLELLCATPGDVLDGTTNKCISNRMPDAAAGTPQSGHPSIPGVKERSSHHKKGDPCKRGLTGNRCKMLHTVVQSKKKIEAGIESSDVKSALCSSNPCLNEGDCVENSGSFTCNCHDKFKGQFCEYVTCPAVLEFLLCSHDGHCVIETMSGRRRCSVPHWKLGPN